MLLDNSKVVTKYAERRKMWITPCKRSAARGHPRIRPTVLCLKKGIM